MESDKMKEEEFVEKSEEEKIQETLAWNFCFVSSAKKSHNRNTALKRHIKVFHPETLAETVHETKTESEESVNIAMDYLFGKKLALMLKRRHPIMKNLQRMNLVWPRRWTISTTCWMKKEEKKMRNPLQLAWTKVVMKENWSRVRNRLRLRWNAILSPVLKVRKSE